MADAGSPKSGTVHGHWRALQLQPVLGSPQLLTVGVVVGLGLRVESFRVLSTLSRVECLLSPGVRKSLEVLLKRTTERLSKFQHGRTACTGLEDISPQLHLGEEMSAQYPSWEEMADDLYEAIVLIQPPKLLDPVEKKRFQPRSAEEVRSGIRPLVISGLVKLKKGQLFETFWREERLLPVMDENPKITLAQHWLEIDLLKPKQRVGAIASACYAEPERVKLNMLSADRDLRTYQQRHPEVTASLYVLRPGAASNIKADLRLAIDNAIDELAWKIRHGKKVTLEAEDSEQALSERVLEDFV